jgi:hypothetical protein
VQRLDDQSQNDEAGEQDIQFVETTEHTPITFEAAE